MNKEDIGKLYTKYFAYRPPVNLFINMPQEIYAIYRIHLKSGYKLKYYYFRSFWKYSTSKPAIKRVE